MSAADKLRALEQRTSSDEDALGELSVYAPWLLEAFPALIAVVEAAEAAYEGIATNDAAFYGRQKGLVAALAALDEALEEK